MMRRVVALLFISILFIGQIIVRAQQADLPPYCQPDLIANQLDSLLELIEQADDSSATTSLEQVNEQLGILRLCYPTIETPTQVTETPAPTLAPTSQPPVEVTELLPRIVTAVNRSAEIPMYTSSNLSGESPGNLMSNRRYAVLAEEGDSLLLAPTEVDYWVWGGFFTPPVGRSVVLETNTPLSNFNAETGEFTFSRSINAGTTVEIRSVRTGVSYNQWVEVQFPNGSGWLPAGYVWNINLSGGDMRVTVPTPTSATTQVTVRSSPTTEGDNAYSFLLRGETVRVLETRTDARGDDAPEDFRNTRWLRIEIVHRLLGYINNDENQIIGDGTYELYETIETRQAVDLLKDDDSNSDPYLTLSPGHFITFLSSSGNWLNVIVPYGYIDQEIGWVSAEQMTNA